MFGGQERYLEILISNLSSIGAKTISFQGGPKRIVSLCESFTKSLGSDQNVVVLNGNRALYSILFNFFRPDVFIYVQHSSYADRQAGWYKYIIRSLLMRAALRRVDAIIRVCDAAIPDSWCRNKLLATVHNGVDLLEFPCKAHWPDMARPLRLLMVGAVNPNKNQKLAILALAQLPAAELTIVGDGPARCELESLAMQLGVSDRIRWAGSHSDTGPFYRQADIYLMLSQFEAMPFVVLESMASGTPVVGFPVGGVPEVIDNGVDGILLPERSAEALVSALKDFAAAPDRLRDMGQRARNKIESGFTANHMTEGFLRVVEEVRKRKRAGRVG